MKFYFCGVTARLTAKGREFSRKRVGFSMGKIKKRNTLKAGGRGVGGDRKAEGEIEN